MYFFRWHEKLLGNLSKQVLFRGNFCFRMLEKILHLSYTVLYSIYFWQLGAHPTHCPEGGDQHTALQSCCQGVGGGGVVIIHLAARQQDIHTQIYSILNWKSRWCPFGLLAPQLVSFFLPISFCM